MSDQRATKTDEALLKSLHPLSTALLAWAAKKPTRKTPKVGIIITDAKLIREVLMTKESYSKKGKGVSSSFWNPIIGETGLLNMDGTPHLQLKRSLASSFNSKNISQFIDPEIDPILKKMESELKSGRPVNIVETISEFVYKSLWRFAGFPDDIIKKHYTNDTINDLRSATHGVNITKKSLSEKQILKARQKLSFIDTITDESYSRQDIQSGSVLEAMKEEGYSLEETASFMKSLMIAGTETVISFLPRAVAILIDSGKLSTLTEEEILPAIDECLRVTVPTPVAVRVATEDTILGHLNVKAGERIILNTLGVCQKEGPFNSNLPPVSRELKGLWFGAGVHMCVGLPIAIYESEKVLQSLTSLTTQHKIKITSRTSAKEGHTGCYESLTLEISDD